MSFDSLRKNKNDTWETYFSLLRYAVLRRIHPRYREQYRLETLVGPRGVWDQLGQYQFNILTGLGLRPEHSLLDIGCGPLTVGLRLIPYLNNGNYVGADVRPEPIIEAFGLTAKHSLANKNPTFVVSSTFGKTELPFRTFDYIWMSQLSYHFDNDLTEILFANVRDMLNPEGVFLFDMLEPNTVLPQGLKWRGFSFHPRPLDYYVELASRYGLSLQNRGTILEFGYPKHMSLASNLLLEVRALSPRTKQVSEAFSDEIQKWLRRLN